MAVTAPAARTLPPHLLAAGTLTLALVGDAVLYAVLPAAAAVYGLGAAGVAAALSVNRFARLVLNPLAAYWLARTGLRRGALAGALVATASTAGYALAPGLTLLLVARVAWGAAFATLRLCVQGYATVDPRRAPRRLGNAASLQELAPAILLVVGAAALAPLGVRGLFVALACLTATSLVLAWALPSVPARSSPISSTSTSEGALDPPGAATGVRRATSLPWGPGALAAAVAFGADGVMMAGMVLALLALGWEPLMAVQLGAWLLAGRKVVQVVIAALAGRIGERYGASRSVRYAALGTAAGLATMALGPWWPSGLMIGAFIAMVAASVVTTLVPATTAGADTGARLQALGWLANARDLGAATGALFVPLVLVGAEASSVGWAFGLPACLVLLGVIAWRQRSD